MARENARKRHEKRYGKPDRMIDKLICEGFITPKKLLTGDYDMSEEFQSALIGETSSLLKSSKVVKCDNVYKYMKSLGKETWIMEKDFPYPVPPWDNTFVEFDTPDSENPFKTVGILVLRSPVIGKDLEDFYGGVIFFTLKNETHAYGPLCYFLFDLAKDKSHVRKFTGTCVDGDRFLKETQSKSIIELVGPMLGPMLLSFSFMNCKNVTTTAIDPDRQLNRERKKGGLKPFVRYHTINIEPVKRILKTDGNVEHNGLAKALHIVRGHFANYSEDKPLFGHPGLSGRFWMPSHVRGNLRNGLVNSDYVLDGLTNSDANG